MVHVGVFLDAPASADPPSSFDELRMRAAAGVFRSRFSS